MSTIYLKINNVGETCHYNPIKNAAKKCIFNMNDFFRSSVEILIDMPVSRKVISKLYHNYVIRFSLSRQREATAISLRASWYTKPGLTKKTKYPSKPLYTSTSIKMNSSSVTRSYFM